MKKLSKEQEALLDLIRSYWEGSPDYRFGKLIATAIHSGPHAWNNFFHMPDEEMASLLISAYGPPPMKTL